MTEEEIDIYIGQATTLTKERISAAERDFGLGSHARFDLDLNNQKIVFKNADGRVVCSASVIPIGSWAKKAESWLWSWENDSIPKTISIPVKAISEFGAQNEIPALEETFSPCDEALAWSLASIALKILNAQSVYRVDQGKNLLFLLLNEIALAH